MIPQSRFNECPKCGELNRKSSTYCGVCGYEFPPEEVVPERDVPGFPSETVFALVGLVLLVCVGVTLIAPGLGILFAILMMAPLVRTLVIVGRRAEHGEQASILTAIGLFLSSVVVTGTVLAVVSVAALGTFCAVCLAAASGGAREGAVVIAALATLAVSALIGFAFWRRFQRRNGRPPY